MASKNDSIPTFSQFVNDRLTEIAGQYWAPFTEHHRPFNPKVVAEIYQNELLQTNFSRRRIMLLEFSQYLEEFLWPNYDPATSSLEHVLSIIVTVNEKHRERVSAWEVFKKTPDNFPGFFRRVMEAALDCAETSLMERTQVIQFLMRCFSSIENDLIRTRIQKLVALPIWINLLPGRREELFRDNPKLKKLWQLVQKHDAKLNPQEVQDVEFERKFLAELMKSFLSVVENVSETEPLDPFCVRYCECFLQMLIDLEALLPTRRFFNVLLDSCHVVTRCSLSPLARRKEGRLFTQLLDMLKFYARFEINDLSGEPLTESDMTLNHYNDITSLQKASFKTFKEELKDFYLLNVASVDTTIALKKYFGRLSKEQLYSVAESLNLVPPITDDDQPSLDSYSDQFLLELLVTRHERRKSQLDFINELPLYPTEDIIWDENLVPSEYFSGEGSLALNKLGLQFLTLYDYLLRNFNLFRLESTYEIRQDVEDAVFRLKPWKHETDASVVFGGWARMALPVVACSIVEVAKPHIGERSPALVRADVTINLNTRADIRNEWEGLRKHDVCFLVTVRPQSRVGTRYDVRKPFQDQIQVAYVRGCEIEGMLGPDGRVIDEFSSEKKPTFSGTIRTFRVWLDCSQYRLDMERNLGGDEDVYETFNVFIRRKPKENNFKAVLDTIRQLMNTKFVVPDWLHDILLGYGDPGAAHYTKMANAVETLDFNDTFLDLAHLKESFADYGVSSEADDQKLVPPFRVSFGDVKEKKRKAGAEESDDNEKQLFVETVVVPSPGPYPYLVPKRNSVRFTPVQIEAIRAGMQPGLTMVVGPPGTGKTDVAVQIISNIYHNWPDQRTLIITHSNQALNQLFEKIMHLDIDERHLLRLGHGEEALETEKDFSRYGRVNYILAKRLELLGEVERLQHSLGVLGDVAYTCETAADFFLYQVHARWEEYQRNIRKRPNQGAIAVEDVGRLFPFNAFFASAPQPLFKAQSYEEDLEIAQSCWRHISRIFQQLDEFRAFELLRTGRDRAEYLLVKEAKIIAMTCTHAALRRRELVQLGFRYDNVLMEEAAQILEIETFIPLLLQEPRDGRNCLKRWIMIGDHHQLPPVIKNMAFQKYCNMEQSLFARLVALGVPTVDLDMQGRARPSLAALYNWRYKRIGNLRHVETTGEFELANPGFAYEYQLIDVGNYNGIGESAPSPYFYQNLAEAEYAVALFMYMRILGYPAERISILTTYNGQKHLIRDVIEQRCAGNPLFGKPHKVTTVDKYQGQQNDYIILSLVRTAAVGHLRDVRRLVVALSRSRLGLYILARVSLFKNCFELSPAFSVLCHRPQTLALLPHEAWPTGRQVTDNGSAAEQVQIEDMSHMVQFVHEFYRANADALKNAWMHSHGIEERAEDLDAQPYDQGKVESDHTLDIDKARKEEGGKVEKDIEFEVIDEEAPPKPT